MTARDTPRSAAAAVLDPVDRASEVIFGLLMAMSFIGSLSVATDGREEVRTMMIAALGCNLAWGLVDAVMHLVAIMTERRRNLRLLRRLQATLNADNGRSLVADALPPLLGSLADAESLERLRQRLLALPPHQFAPRLGLADYKAALGIFLLVVLVTFPLVVPFMFVHETALALQLSQGTAIVILFLAGAALSRYSGGSIWRGGLVMAALGIALSAAIAALGG
jgi:VIT1/CCC1 family predicted Fe2+/Mn2+ transporter